MPRTGAPDGLNDPFGAKDRMDFDSDDEEGVDEETWNAPVSGLSCSLLMGQSF